MDNFTNNTLQISMECKNNELFGGLSSLPSLPLISDIQPSSVSLLTCNPLNTEEYESKRSFYSIEDKSVAKVHYLWESGLWNTTKQNVDNFDTNLLHLPKIVVIEPKCFDNFDKLSRTISFQHQMTQPVFTVLTKSNLSRVSPNITLNSSLSLLDRFDDTMSIGSNLSTQSNISHQFVKSCSPSPVPIVPKIPTIPTTSPTGQLKTSKQFGSFKNYVFFSNRLTSVLQRKLGEQALGLEYQSLYQLEARKFQYSILRGDIRIVKIYNNNNNSHNQSVTDYLIFKFGRASSTQQLYGICERNDRQPEKQPWCCQHIKSLKEMISFFRLNTLNLDIQQSFLNNVQIKDKIIEKRFNPSTNYNTNIINIAKMLQNGFDKYCKDLQNHNNGYLSDSGINSNNSNRHHKRNRNETNKSNKIKNQDKFSYLSNIGHCLGVTFTQLLGLVGEAIENAFVFGQRYPQTVLTQGYVDEERGTLSFELVLLAEIYDQIRGQYYKFGVPIVERYNKQIKQCYYEAKNILTPKMINDNIRINSHNAIINKNTWVEYLNNNNISYYTKLDNMWFINIGNIKAFQRLQINTFKTITNVNVVNHRPTKPNKPNNSNKANMTRVASKTGQVNAPQTLRAQSVSNDKAKKTPRALVTAAGASFDSFPPSTRLMDRDSYEIDVKDDEDVQIKPKVNKLSGSDINADNVDNIDNDNGNDDGDNSDDEMDVKPSGTLKRSSVEVNIVK